MDAHGFPDGRAAAYRSLRPGACPPASNGPEDRGDIGASVDPTWISCHVPRSRTGALPTPGNLPTIRQPVPRHQAMLLGEVFLETMATGIITQEEIDWLTTHQADFNREEEAKALRIGRLLDEGTIQIGCRLLDQAS